MTLQCRIGLVYLPGALPCFESFGNLPTDVVRADAEIDGKPFSEVLDMLIIPGGSLVESQSVNPKVASEIIKMADKGKFILGVCSGFQVLAKETDVGRLSTIPVIRSGLGLLDAEFKPLICTDRVKADVTGESFLTRDIGKQVNGFHCHTYGDVVVGQDAKRILVTHADRINYFEKGKSLVSGVSNRSGNVVGVFIHGLLDSNPLITQGIMNSLDIRQTDLKVIHEANAEFIRGIKCEVGVATGIYPKQQVRQKTAKVLMVTALGSGSGKTFLVTGIAGALKKVGWNVGVVKVGGDVRDIVPALYLTKEPMKEDSSIRVGSTGWTPLEQVMQAGGRDYDFLLVEGAMNAFTGLLNDNNKRPMSTVEVAAASGANTVLVVACNQTGLEGALLDTVSNIAALKHLGVNVVGVILNKLHISYMTKETVSLMQRAFANVGVQLIGTVPKLDLEHRGMIPEVEIRYEDFCSQAVEAVEENLNLKLLAEVAAPAEPVAVDYKALSEEFKNLLTGASPKSGKAANTSGNQA
ncbi:AAA family ATPase [Candidatus Bathyarchaeota archaeon]|nr:AAA family ATPase [Candidatus Bathyarchaeota archaeon]